MKKLHQVCDVMSDLLYDGGATGGAQTTNEIICQNQKKLEVQIASGAISNGLAPPYPEYRPVCGLFLERPGSLEFKQKYSYKELVNY